MLAAWLWNTCCCWSACCCSQSRAATAAASAADVGAELAAELDSGDEPADEDAEAALPVEVCDLERLLPAKNFLNISPMLLGERDRLPPEACCSSTELEAEIGDSCADWPAWLS